MQNFADVKKRLHFILFPCFLFLFYFLHFLHSFYHKATNRQTDRQIDRHKDLKFKSPFSLILMREGVKLREKRNWWRKRWEIVFFFWLIFFCNSFFLSKTLINAILLYGCSTLYDNYDDSIWGTTTTMTMTSKLYVCDCIIQTGIRTLRFEDRLQFNSNLMMLNKNNGQQKKNKINNRKKRNETH